jgi:ketosteroid isomerase-like protein
MTRLILLLLLAPLAHAQRTPDPQLPIVERPAPVLLTDAHPHDPDSAVVAPIHALFDAMRAGDADALLATFHPDATLRSTQARPDQEPAVSQTPIADFAASVASATATLDESLDAVHLRVDGPLATAWTPYRFYVDGQFSHCGVNAFTLVETDTGWKILHVVDTRRREGCTP